MPIRLSTEDRRGNTSEHQEPEARITLVQNERKGTKLTPEELRIVFERRITNAMSIILANGNNWRESRDVFQALSFRYEDFLSNEIMGLIREIILELVESMVPKESILLSKNDDGRKTHAEFADEVVEKMREISSEREAIMRVGDPFASTIQNVLDLDL